jgi:hypothetical protein
MNLLVLKFVQFVDSFEYFTIPICFLLGLLGNTTGSVCLLTKRKTSKHTSLFILAIIGLVDNIFLLTQLQRWLATNNENEKFVNNHIFCKFYLMFTRFSVLLSISLLMCLIIRAYFEAYMKFRLSKFNSFGQIVSNLSIIYMFALTLSISWHELWTSGLKNENGPLYDQEYFFLMENISAISISLFTTYQHQYKYYSYYSYTIKNLTNSFQIECSKNVNSLSIVGYLNGIYFFISALILMISLSISLMILVKVKDIKYIYEFFKRFDYNVTGVELDELDRPRSLLCRNLNNNNDNINIVLHLNDEIVTNMKPLELGNMSELLSIPPLQSIRPTVSLPNFNETKRINDNNKYLLENELSTQIKNLSFSYKYYNRNDKFSSRIINYGFDEIKLQNSLLQYNKTKSFAMNHNRFAHYLILLSFITNLLSLPYIYYDATIYTTVIVNKLINEVKDLKFFVKIIYIYNFLIIFFYF